MWLQYELKRLLLLGNWEGGRDARAAILNRTLAAEILDLIFNHFTPFFGQAAEMSFKTSSKQSGVLALKRASKQNLKSVFKKL